MQVFPSVYSIFVLKGLIREKKVSRFIPTKSRHKVFTEGRQLNMEGMMRKGFLLPKKSPGVRSELKKSTETAVLEVTNPVVYPLKLVDV